MGVDCRITLPGDTRVRDVASVIGILAGHPKHWYVTQDKKASWIEVDRVEIANRPTMDSYCEIHLLDDDGKIYHHTLFFFEWEYPLFGRYETKGLSPNANPFWQNIGMGLIKFFGGSLDLNDCDDVRVDRWRKKPRKRNNPSTNAEWDAFQKQLDLLEPIPNIEVKLFWE